MKKYRAIFFDWDGTAVASRRADYGAALLRMRPLLDAGVLLAIVSATTYDNICEGRLEELLPPRALDNLYLSLARGNAVYGFSGEGALRALFDGTPDKADLLRLHRLCADLHEMLLDRFNLPTDIIFSRPNYCKLDLMANKPRGKEQFLQTGEVEAAEALLSAHGIEGGLRGLIDLTTAFARQKGLPLFITCDAKYLEVGYTTKSSGVDFLADYFEARGVLMRDCAFFGDEFGQIAEGIYGNDAQMMTKKTALGDFFSVSKLSLPLPSGVSRYGRGCEAFLEFLDLQARA